MAPRYRFPPTWWSPRPSRADAPATVKAATDVADDDLILDIGPQTAAKLAAQLKAAGTIVWNGPVGRVRVRAFENGTKAIAQAIAESPAFSIAGGGDTLAAIAKYGIEKDVGYISTGGGAFLEVLEGKTLPAFEILQKRASARELPATTRRLAAMTFIEQLRDATARNDSLLCVGLDPEPARFPAGLRGDAGRIYDFCAAIVDATADLACAFKPQIAYFAAHRAEEQLERLVRHMRATAPHVPVILDAKRGDIGSTAQQYAIEASERYGADAVTLSPFMGFDSIEPYLAYHGKGAFLLCRTSNPGGA